jgi:hypothetical protein
MFTMAKYKLIFFFLNHLDKGWELVAAGDHKCHPNGILGLLCREHFPGLVNFAGGVEPAYTFEHYISALDTQDQDGRKFDNKAERVTKELWVSLSCSIHRIPFTSLK